MPRKTTPKTIPNAPFRERFRELEAREGLTLSDVAERCDWFTKGRNRSLRPDCSRVARKLGITAEGGRFQTRVTFAIAATLCLALHMDYTDVGI